MIRFSALKAVEGLGYLSFLKKGHTGSISSLKSRNSRPSTAFLLRQEFGHFWLYVWDDASGEMAKSWPLHPGKIINFSGFSLENGKKHESRYFAIFWAFWSKMTKTGQKLAKGCISFLFFMAWLGQIRGWSDMVMPGP